MTDTRQPMLPPFKEEDALLPSGFQTWSGEVRFIANDQRAEEVFAWMVKQFGATPQVLLEMLRGRQHPPFSLPTSGWQYHFGEPGSGHLSLRTVAVKPTPSLTFAPWETPDEVRKLKDQLIEREREVLRLRRRELELQSQTNQLLDAVSAYREADRAQRGMLLAREHGRVLLCETHCGRVSEVVGAEAEVIYDGSDPDEEPFSQVFHRDQFNRGQLPKAGTRVETFVLMAALTGAPIGEVAPTVEETPNFEGLGETGPVRL